jgi:molecular chaperone IbpA
MHPHAIYGKEEINHRQTPTALPVDPFAALQRALTPWTVGIQPHLIQWQSIAQSNRDSSYPPYNIIDLGKDKYEIELAVAGFSKEDIKIEFKDSVVTVSGVRESLDKTYLHKGVAAREFEKKFGVADDVKILGASLKEGILKISLEREVPEHLKARTIPIK